jgi:hypothetical protein
MFVASKTKHEFSKKAVLHYFHIAFADQDWSQNITRIQREIDRYIYLMAHGQRYMQGY